MEKGQTRARLRHWLSPAGAYFVAVGEERSWPPHPCPLLAYLANKICLPSFAYESRAQYRTTSTITRISQEMWMWWKRDQNQFEQPISLKSPSRTFFVYTYPSPLAPGRVTVVITFSGQEQYSTRNPNKKQCLTHSPTSPSHNHTDFSPLWLNQPPQLH